MNLSKRSLMLFIGLIAVMLAAAVAWVNPTRVEAAGYLIKDDYAGPYHISIWASPNPVSVGKITLSIRLGQKGGVSQEWPVRNADLRVQFKQLTGPGTENNPKKLLYSNVLVAPEDEPGNYSVSDSLDAEGKYNILIDINAGLGKQHYEFQVNALPQPEDRIFSIFLLVMLALLIFAMVWAYLHSPRQSEETVETNGRGTAGEVTKTEEKVNL